MRILVLNYEFPPLGGGAGNATACLSREWAALGHEVTVITGGFRDLPKRETRDGYTVKRLPTPRKHQGQCSVTEMGAFIPASCAAVLAEPRPDIVIAFFSIPSAPAAYLLKMLRGVPYIVSLRGGDVPGFDAKHMAKMHALTNPLTALLWRNAAAVIGNSAGLCQLGRDFMPGLAVPEIPNGVDTTLFSPAENRKPSSQPELLFIGRLASQKGLHDLLDALALLRVRQWHLRIVGDGPERDALVARTAELGLADRITFHGWAQRTELPALYRAADVFVFPSHDEGMPNVVLEALASGLPIVATRIAGSEQLVNSGSNGTLVPVRDPAAFADALQPLLADADLRRRMGAASRTLAVEQYSWAIPAAEYIRVAEQGVAS